MQAVNLLPAYARPAGRWASVGRDLSPARVVRIGCVVAVAAAVADTSSSDTSSATSTTTTVAPSPPAAPVGSGFTVAGSANSHVRVALVLDRLALIPWLSGVSLQSSTHSGGVAGTASAGDQF